MRYRLFPTIYIVGRKYICLTCRASKPPKPPNVAAINVLIKYISYIIHHISFKYICI